MDDRKDLFLDEQTKFFSSILAIVNKQKHKNGIDLERQSYFIVERFFDFIQNLMDSSNLMIGYSDGHNDFVITSKRDATDKKTIKDVFSHGWRKEDQWKLNVFGEKFNIIRWYGSNGKEAVDIYLNYPKKSRLAMFCLEDSKTLDDWAIFTKEIPYIQSMAFSLASLFELNSIKKSYEKLEYISEKIERVNLNSVTGFSGLVEEANEIVIDLLAYRGYMAWNVFYSKIDSIVSKIALELLNAGPTLIKLKEENAIAGVNTFISSILNTKNVKISWDNTTAIDVNSLRLETWLKKDDKQHQKIFATVFMLCAFVPSSEGKNQSTEDQEQKEKFRKLLIHLEQTDKIYLISTLPLWVHQYKYIEQQFNKGIEEEYLDYEKLLMVSHRSFSNFLVDKIDGLKKIGAQAPPPAKEQSSDESIKRLSGETYRNWVHIWFITKLIEHELGSYNAEKSLYYNNEKYKFYSDLSFVIRETIRYEIFGDRQDYVSNPNTYTEALYRLVEHHLHKIIKLPHEFDLRRYFREVSKVWGLSDQNSPTNYLDHVLDVYIVGHFLLSFKIPNGKIDENNVDPEGSLSQSKGDEQEANEWTLARWLASPTGLPPGEKLKNEFLQAFSMAALFHDISHLVCPFEEGAGTSLFSEMRIPQLNLENVEETLRQAGGGVAKQCIADLEAEGYFDRKDELELDLWLKAQIDRGEPDHGIISAWYLHHICNQEPTENPTILSKAVRAILLHNAAPVPIDCEKDPLASVLIVTNELLEWDLGHHVGFYAGGPGDVLRSLAVRDTKREARFQWVKMKGFSMSKTRAKEPYPLNFYIKPPKGFQSRSYQEESWPVIYVQLQEPEKMDVPTFVLWLLKAQQFARLKPGEKNCWAPCMTIISKSLSSGFLPVKNSVQLLCWLAQESSLPVRPALIRWLDHLLKEGEKGPLLEIKDREEIIRLTHLKKALYHEDIRRWIPRLTLEATAILEKRARR